MKRRDEAPELVEQQPVDEVARLEGEITRLEKQRVDLDRQAQDLVTRDVDAAAELDAKSAGIERTIDRLRRAIADEQARRDQAERELEAQVVQQVVEKAFADDKRLVDALEPAIAAFVAAYSALVRIVHDHHMLLPESYLIPGGSQVAAMIFDAGRARFPGENRRGCRSRWTSPRSSPGCGAA